MFVMFVWYSIAHITASNLFYTIIVMLPFDKRLDMFSYAPTNTTFIPFNIYSGKSHLIKLIHFIV